MKKYPEWVNTPVITKALDNYESGFISKNMALWLKNLLEIKEDPSSLI
tara:strand:+ start:828 stop:971 length:144 start_codon:yes stop_codon:yes gene_type:complete